MQNKNQPVIARSTATKQSIQKSCHSRVSLSGIYNACCCKIKEKSLLNKCVEDPRLQASGMTANLYPLTCPSGHPLPQGARRTTHGGFTARSVTPQGRYAGYSGHIGFTLIELLVTVLIIGILAAVAVPQYQRAIDMLRITRALEMSKNLAYAETVYYLSNGTYTKDLSKLDVDLGECTCTNTACTTWNCDGYSVWISDMGTVIDLNKSWTGGDIVRVEYYLVERKKGWRVGYASTERFQNIWTKKLGGVPMQGNPGYFRLSANW